MTIQYNCYYINIAMRLHNESWPYYIHTDNRADSIMTLEFLDKKYKEKNLNVNHQIVIPLVNGNWPVRCEKHEENWASIHFRDRLD